MYAKARPPRLNRVSIRATPCEHCAVSEWSLAWSRVARVGHGIYYVVMTCCFVMAVAIGVAAWMDRDLPTQWGTFTEESTHCDPFYDRYGTCTSTGTWVSDDGKSTLHQVSLDGDVARHGTVRASYKPGGAMESNDVVHKATRTHPDLWLPWVLAAVIAASTMVGRRRWRGRGAKQTTEANHREIARSPHHAVYGEASASVADSVRRCGSTDLPQCANMPTGEQETRAIS